MEKIYSRVDPDKLLHMVFRYADMRSGRIDLSAPEEYIQCAALRLQAGTTFVPHKHNTRLRTWDEIAQESWHVIKGHVKCMFYDLDDTLLEEVLLWEGDTSFTFAGGHNYLILEDDTEVLEYKTGKYEGHDIDKTTI